MKDDNNTGTKDGGGTGLVDHVVVLRRDHSADNDQNIRPAHFPQHFDELRDQSAVSCRQG